MARMGGDPKAQALQVLLSGLDKQLGMSFFTEKRRSWVMSLPVESAEKVVGTANKQHRNSPRAAQGRPRGSQGQLESVVFSSFPRSSTPLRSMDTATRRTSIQGCELIASTGGESSPAT